MKHEEAGDQPVGGGASVDPAKAGGYRFASGVVVLSDPRGIQAEAIRALRTHIMAQHVDDGRRGLAICAASLDVGCTFTAVNLAVALSQIGVKTLLIDGDLARPAVESFIVPDGPKLGLRQYLQAPDTDSNHQIQNDVLPDLAVMYAGAGSPDGRELLAADRFKDLIDRCLRDYDLTIVDTPPANSSADGRRISTVIGYSVIVARRHQSLVNDVTVLAAQLREDRARVIGTVMNEG